MHQIQKIRKYFMYLSYVSKFLCLKSDILGSLKNCLQCQSSYDIFFSRICILAYLCLSKYSIQIGEGNNEENENNIHELATFSNEAFHQDEEN